MVPYCLEEEEPGVDAFVVGPGPVCIGTVGLVLEKPTNCELLTEADTEAGMDELDGAAISLWCARYADASDYPLSSTSNALQNPSTRILTAQKVQCGILLKAAGCPKQVTLASYPHTDAAEIIGSLQTHDEYCEACADPEYEAHRLPA